MVDRIKQPVRVLHVISVQTENCFLQNLVDHSERRRIEFTVVTLAGEGTFATELRKRGITVYCLDCNDRLKYPRSLFHLFRIICRHKIDIVHTHLFDPTWLGLIAAKLRARGVIVTRHYSDDLHNIRTRLKRWAYLGLGECCSLLADHIIAPSVGVRKLLVSREGIRASKVALIPYGQDAGRFNAVTQDTVARVKAELGIQGMPILVCVSRLHWEKGHIYLFKALSVLKDEFPGLSLYLVGDGPYRSQLEGAVQGAGIAPMVKFLGWRNDALEILAAADIVVHPSFREALPSAVIEALALGKPVIASDVAGVEDILNGYGRIVPPADSNALIGALRSTVTNLEAANCLAAKGRFRILETMAASKVAQAHMEVYQSVMAGR